MVRVFEMDISICCKLNKYDNKICIMCVFEICFIIDSINFYKFILFSIRSEGILIDCLLVKVLFSKFFFYIL